MRCAITTDAKRTIGAAVVLALSVIVAARSQTPRDADLDRIRGDISRMRDRLESVRRQATSAHQELEAVDLELGIRTRELELAIEVQDQLATERNAVAADIAALESRLGVQRQYLRRRLSALYKMGGLGYVRLFLSMDRRRDPVAAVSMLTYLVSRDGRAVSRFQLEQAELAARQSTLADREGRLAAMRQLIEDRHKAVAEAHAQKQAAVAALEREERGSARQLADLEEKARRLERLIDVLAKQATGADAAIDVRTVQGALPWPVTGAVTERFGRQRNPKFETFTINNGIKIATAAGTPVHAVHQGTVLFSEWFKGYGNLIIVDHGHRVFSLYGNLKAPTVAVGDHIASGQTIAGVGEGDEASHGYLYFEIREDNHPVDPQKWLR